MNHNLLFYLNVILVLTVGLCAATPAKKLKQNKFTSRTVQDIENTVFKDHLRHPSHCGYQLHLGWTADTGSVAGIHAHPMIRPAYLSTVEGRQDSQDPSAHAVCIASLSGTVTALRADDGSPLPGWPLSSAAAASHSAPVLIDTDGDGSEEMVLATTSGQIVKIASDGSQVTPLFRLPPVKVRRDWYAGLDPQQTDIVEQMPQHDTVPSDQSQTNQNTKGQQQQQQQQHNNNNNNNDNFRTRRLQQQEQTAEGWLSPEAKEAMTLLGTVSAYGDEQDMNDDEGTSRKRWPEGYVLVDPHILATPIKVDVDGDGRDDLVLAVSYYFDAEQYKDPVRLNKLPPNVDPDNYVASALVAITFASSGSPSVLWSTTLDLTTAHLDSGRAHIHGSPIAADITGTGHPDIVVATGVGFIYVLDRHGDPVSPFPVQMASLQSTPLVADVNGDGSLEICAADTKSNLACFTSDGKELWERRLTSFNAAGMAAGDVDGDGAIDLVIPEGDGRLYVVRGQDGDVLPGFPVVLSGAVHSPPALVSMPTSSTASNMEPQIGQHLTIITASSDGHLSLVEGKTGCVDKVDIGENVFGGLEVSDLDNDGRIDILLATMHGSVAMLHTDVPAHPLRTWHPLQQQSLEGAGSIAVYVSPNTRLRGDVVGPHFAVELRIVDERRLGMGAPPRQYHIKIFLASGHVLYDEMYSEPGVYTVKLDAPTQRMTSTITVRMVNEHGAVIEDSFQVSFNMNFWRILKWIVVLPFILSFGVILLKNQRDTYDKEP